MIARPLLWVLFLASLLARCGEEEPKETRTPPSRTGVEPGVPPPAVGPPAAGGPVQSLQMTQIMVAYRSKLLPTHKRTKEEARAFALELQKQIREGADIEKLVYAHTDDRGDDGQPFNRGSYSLDPRDRRTQAGLIAAVQATPVGSLAKEPYDSGLAYIVFRRDR